MARRHRRERVEPSRKEQVMTRREQEQARRITSIVGVALGVAVIVLLAGVLIQFVITPGSAAAVVGDVSIATRDLWDRTRFEQLQLMNQLQQTLNFQQQIDPTGEQGFFTAQIQQLQSRLAHPEGLANQVLEDMIHESVIPQAAREAGVVPSEAEINTKLPWVIARQTSAVTAPPATATL